VSLLNTGLVAAPHHTGPPGGVHLSLCSPFGAPQSAKPCYEGGGGQYLLLMDWPVSYSVSLFVFDLILRTRGHECSKATGSCTK
jgi:hypothetical protein